MRLITASELAKMTNFELSALYASVREELERTNPDSYEHDVLTTALENIRRAFAAPRIKPPGM